MISNNVKNAFKVEKLPQIPRIREFSYVAMKDKRKEKEGILIKKWCSNE